MRRGVHLLPLVLVSWLWLVGCDFNREGKPSILIVAVEGLGFDSVGCDQDLGESQSALRVLCEESVRFSHAFAPSTMSQASLASLLTGMYPASHGVRHNGSDFLSARHLTAAEAALARGYRTLFVSGGPPIWRKSGLAQGFEVFDDQVEIAPNAFFRPVDEVVRIATHWIESEASSRPFLATLFLADLQFPQVPTRNDDGELREISPEAQRAEIMESLGYLISWLKAKKLWNSTHVVLAGLNSLNDAGEGGERESEPQTLSLRSRSVQVSLFIKPSRKERDNLIQWAVDKNASLVDVGATILEWLGQSAPQSTLPDVRVQSLSTVLIKAEPGWKENRLILSESAWPNWLEGAGVRSGVRQNQFLYIHDRHPLIFNTLTDRLETMPLKIDDPLWNSVNGEVLGMVQSADLPAFGGIKGDWTERLEDAARLWQSGSADREPTGREYSARWQLSQAVASRDWARVKRIAKVLGDPLGTYFASRGAGERVAMPKSACVRMMFATKGDRSLFKSDCDDDLVTALFDWQNARGEEEKVAAQDRFARLYRHHRLDEELGRLNYLLDLRWDVDRDLPGGPQLIDYVLTMKEFEAFAKKAQGF